MKTGTFIKSTAFLLILAGGAYVIKPDFFQDYLPDYIQELIGSKTNLPATVQKAIKSGDYNRVQKTILQELKGKKITPESPEVLEMAMLHSYISTTAPDLMTDFAARSKSRAKFLAEFSKDAEWQAMCLNCGLVPYKSDTGLDVLYRIWKSEDGKVQNKALAAALASAWGGGETDASPREKTRNPNKFNPVWRYHFFVKNDKKGKLHPNFKNLQPWELRFVVGNPWQDWDDKSFEYALENINMPWDQYNNACWAATYTDTSKFGDTVQGGMYNLPYSEQSQAEACHRNGGVCGAMSHLGCVAAQAHGIPAYTVGQPGHCAYAIRVERGKWIGGFGGPDGGMHNRIFGNQAPTSYELMETVFADDNNIKKAYDYAHCARAKAAMGDTEGAIKMWKLALDRAPLHPFFRSELAQQMKNKGITPEEAFDYLSKTTPLYQGHGFAAINMANDFADEIKAMNDDQKIQLYRLQHDVIATTKASWAVKCEELIQKQADTLANNKAKEKFLGNALASHMNAKDATTFGQLLEWSVKNYIAKGQEAIFSKAFANAVTAASDGKTTNSDDAEAAKTRLKSLTATYNKGIFATEQARSASAFQALTNAAQASCGPCPINIKLKSNMAGKPLEAAMFRISTTCSYDSPIWHRNITTPTGGKCHTAKEKAPHMVVELPKRQFVSGCIIRKMDGNEHRMKNATLYTSEDGATWIPRQSTNQMPKEWVVNFDEGTSAKWLKVEFDNGNEQNFAHISHFVVYGK